MVAVDASTGSPVRVGGAALASGPAIAIHPVRRDDAVKGVGGASSGGLGARRPQAPAPWQPVAPAAAPTPPVAEREVLPATWGVPAYFAGAPFGPPYELPERTAEWELSVETRRAFREHDRVNKMALKIHPRGPELQSAGTFLNALYGLTPAPSYLGVGLDMWL